ncbi:MAG: glycosyltransferase [Burkholderiales bacterium]|nr:glycosyltransferase [Burkholderiales bacterium]
MTNILHRYQKKILILSVSAGAGHARAAEALRVQAALTYPEAEVVHLDAMDYVTRAFKQIYTDFYIQLVDKAPSLWSYLYNFSNEAKADSGIERLRRSIERWNAAPLLRKIKEFQADAIICTHFLPAEMLARLIAKQELHCPVWVQVTDFDLHRMWVHQGMTGYFAANEEVAFRMGEQGLPVDRVHVTGIPIMPTFTQKLNRPSCAWEAGLDPDVLTIMMMGGGAGVGNLETMAERLLKLDVGTPFQLLVLTGKNQQALHALQNLAIAYPGRLSALGFTTRVERLMACADLMITKPGGLTTSECLAMGLPMIVNAPIPGQEERNADYVMEQGAAWKAVDHLALEFRVRELLRNPEQLQHMRNQAQRIGRPQAAKQVLLRVMADLERRDAKLPHAVSDLIEPEVKQFDYA